MIRWCFLLASYFIPHHHLYHHNTAHTTKQSESDTTASARAPAVPYQSASVPTAMKARNVTANIVKIILCPFLYPMKPLYWSPGYCQAAFSITTGYFTKPVVSFLALPFAYNPTTTPFGSRKRRSDSSPLKTGLPL